MRNRKTKPAMILLSILLVFLLAFGSSLAVFANEEEMEEEQAVETEQEQEEEQEEEQQEEEAQEDDEVAVEEEQEEEMKDEEEQKQEGDEESVEEEQDEVDMDEEEQLEEEQLEEEQQENKDEEEEMTEEQEEKKQQDEVMAFQQQLLEVEDFTILYDGEATTERYYHPENTVCPENKIEDPSGGTVQLGNTGKTFTYSVNSNNELTWSVDEGIHITTVSVKGGQQNAGFHYHYSEPVSGDSGLHANVKNNSPQGVSHFSFCWVEIEDPTASLTIIKELFNDEDELVEGSEQGFEVLINDSDSEEFWKGNISAYQGFSDDEMTPGTYFIKENVSSADFTVTYWMDETELTPDGQGFVEIELEEDDKVTIIIQNRPVEEEDPEEESIELEIIKRIVLLNDEDEEVDVDDMDEFLFEVTLTESPFEDEGENDSEIIDIILLEDESDTFAGPYTIHTGEGGNDGKTHFFVNFPNLTPFYTVEETEVNEEDGFSLLRYEVRFFDEEGTQIGTTDIETTDSFALNMGKYEVVPSRVEITVFNLFTPEDEPEDPVDDPEDPVDDPEDPVDEPEDPVDEPDDPVDEPDDDDPIVEVDDDDPVPAAPPVEAPPVETFETIEAPTIPLAAPVAEPQVDPEVTIVLDEPIPLAPPVLPQTGDSNPLHYALAGLLLMAAGFIFRKRVTA